MNDVFPSLHSVLNRKYIKLMKHGSLKMLFHYDTDTCGFCSTVYRNVSCFFHRMIMIITWSHYLVYFSKHTVISYISFYSMLTFKFSCDKRFRWHDGSTVTLRHFHCQCAGWWRAVLSEGRPCAHGYSRGLTGLPPSEQRGSSWAATPSPACYHPRTLWTGTHSTTRWWDTHTYIYIHMHISIHTQHNVRMCGNKSF